MTEELTGIRVVARARSIRRVGVTTHAVRAQRSRAVEDDRPRSILALAMLSAPPPAFDTSCWGQGSRARAMLTRNTARGAAGCCSSARDTSCPRIQKVVADAREVARGASIHGVGALKRVASAAGSRSSARDTSYQRTQDGVGAAPEIARGAPIYGVGAWRVRGARRKILLAGRRYVVSAHDTAHTKPVARR